MNDPSDRHPVHSDSVYRAVVAYVLDYRDAPSLRLCHTLTYLIEYDREHRVALVYEPAS